MKRTVYYEFWLFQLDGTKEPTLNNDRLWAETARPCAGFAHKEDALVLLKQLTSDHGTIKFVVYRAESFTFEGDIRENAEKVIND